MEVEIVLGMTMDKEMISREEALEALYALCAEAADLPEMTLDETKEMFYVEGGAK